MGRFCHPRFRWTNTRSRLAAIALYAVACDATIDPQVIVRLDADEQTHAMATWLTIRVLDHEGRIALDREVEATLLPVTIPLTARNGDPNRTFDLTAKLLAAGRNEVSVVRARGRYEPGAVLDLPLRFSDDCLGIFCCPDETCWQGECAGACFAAVPRGADNTVAPDCRNQTSLGPPASDEVREGLSTWLSMDEGLTDGAVTDDVGNVLASCVGEVCPTVTIGVHGLAMSFDGVDDHLVAAHTEALAASDGFTVAAWIRPKVLRDYISAFGKRFSGAEGMVSWGFDLEANGKLAFVTYTEGFYNDHLSAGAVAQQCEWLHVAASWDGSTTTLFTNGQLSGSSEQEIEFDEGPLVVGGALGVGGLRYPFAGEVDDLRFYQRPLDPDEIAEIGADLGHAQFFTGPP